MYLAARLTLLLILLSPTTWTWAQTDRQNVDAEALLLMAFDDSLDHDFLLEEVGIIAKQKQKLKQLSKDTLKHWLKLTGTNAGRNQRELAIAMNDLQEEFLRGIGDVLLRHQVKELAGIFRQREILRKFDCESFEVIARGQLNLGLSQAEMKTFLSDYAVVRQRFFTSKTKLKTQALEKLKPHLSDAMKSQLRKMFAIFDSTSTSPEFRRPEAMDQVKNWKAEDFDLLEERELQRLIYDLPYNETLRLELELSGDQLADIENTIRNGPDGVSLPQPSMADKAKMKELFVKGDVEALKRLDQKRRQSVHEFRQLAVEQIARETLAADQVALLTTAAEFYRRMFEGGYPDELSAIGVWIESQTNLNDEDRSEVEKTVKAGRELYTKKLDELRETAESEVLALLPAKARKTFRAEYFRFYDYQAEKMAARQGRQ